MARLRSIAGYTWAAAAIVVVFATFLGEKPFSRALVSASGVKITPRYSGGEVVKTIDHGAYKAMIHRPVFDALIGQAKEGFIQVNWEPLAGLPPVIEETVSYNGAVEEDFSLRVDTTTGETTLARSNPRIIAVERSLRLDNGWLVRVRLKNRE